MNSTIKTIYKTVGALSLATLVYSCSDEAVPLRPYNGETPQESNYTWSTTADSMQTATYNTYLGSNGTFVTNNVGDATFQYWPNAHALHVLVDGYERTKDDSYLAKMKALLNGIKTNNNNTYDNDFNDDMLWLANACVRAYVATNDQDYKDVAEYLWAEIKTSWSDVYGGGISWRKSTPLSKNAVSNGPAAVLALRLYAIDGDQDDLDWAKKIYAWEKDNLVDPNTGLVWDNMNTVDGQVVVQKDWIFTYNVGTYIGAALRMYHATNDATYLNDAVKTAKSTITSGKLTSNGLLKDEGQGDGGLFKGILVRYFAELILEADINDNDRQTFTDFFAYNAETFYDNGLSRPSMLCGPNWGQLPSDQTDLTTQLSGMMLIEAAAKLDAQGVFEE
ncbi:glycoside hydrolase family 76 protein [Zhouia sp. PK063]|uniref:glycoside hydrolase family 76 protein n=1 Tax=Zhouia sp. PK063 TaxID=3373602 RepID=UPI0037928A51